MRRPALLLALAVAALASGLASADAAPRTGRLLVILRPAAAQAGGAPTATAAVATAVAAAAGATPSGPQVPQIGLVTVRPRPGETLTQLAARLRRDPRVRAVSVDHRASPRAVVLPNDPALTEAELAPGTPAGTPVEWWALRERFPEAWAITHGQGAKVAIVDTGVDATHPELAGQIIARNDEDAFSHSGAGVDETGHGTHVASLACATANNGIGIAGAGYDCSLIVEKSDLSDASNIAAIVDAADRGADAINMSFGVDPDPDTGITPPPSQALVDALTYARKKGAVLVAAAADQAITNQGDPADVLQPTGTGPKISEGMGLSVTAAQADGSRAWFAGYGSQISIAAYGAWAQDAGPAGLLGALPVGPVSIEEADPGPPATPGCGCRTTFDGDSRYGYLAGTSMATPQVTAVAALMRHLNPALTPAVVERLIKQTASRPTGTWTAGLGWGILDAGAALTAARDTDRTRPVATIRLVRRIAGGLVVRVTAHDPAPAGVRASGVKSTVLYRTVGSRRQVVRVPSSGSVTLRGAVGSTVRLAVRATDRAGNRQKLTATALRITR